MYTIFAFIHISMAHRTRYMTFVFTSWIYDAFYRERQSGTRASSFTDDSRCFRALVQAGQDPTHVHCILYYCYFRQHDYDAGARATQDFKFISEEKCVLCKLIVQEFSHSPRGTLNNLLFLWQKKLKESIYSHRGLKEKEKS